jgi:hypothetical protein
MKLIKFPGILALSFVLVGLPFTMQAADTAEKPAAADAAATKEKYSEYTGTVSAVDKDKKSFTVTQKKGDLVLVVTDKTKILDKTTKAAKTFDDITVGTYLTGSYAKDGDTLNAHSVHFGSSKGGKKSKTTATPAADAPKQ